MPIKWSAVAVSDKVDEMEKLYNSITPTLWQVLEKAEELRRIPNLPGYIDQPAHSLVLKSFGVWQCPTTNVKRGFRPSLKGGETVPLPDKIETPEDLAELEAKEDKFEGEIIPLDENLAKALIKALEEKR